MATTIGYILDHPEEFDRDWKAIVIDFEFKPEEQVEKPKKQKQKNNTTQFTIWGPINISLNGVYEKIPQKLYDRLKQITGLIKEGENINYWSDHMWFVTRSQKTLDKVNKEFGTDFKFGSVYESSIGCIYKDSETVE